MHRLPRTAAILAVCLVTAPTLALAQTADVRAQIDAVNKKFVSAVKQGDAKALAALYTADAQLLPPASDVVQGPKAIADFWGAGMKSGISEVELTTREVMAQGDTAYEIGAYAIQDKEDKVLDRGKYIVIWKRDQAAWKLHRDIWNSSMSPAPAK